jgi:putative oxidoreductase
MLFDIHNIAFIIGRLIVGCFFLMNGFNHFAQLNMMTGYAKGKGVPAPALAVGGSGVLLFLGGLSVLLGYHPTIGAALLVIFLLGVSFGIHNFWTVQDQQARMGEMINFLKNMAILGLLLMTLAIPRPWAMSLGGPEGLLDKGNYSRPFPPSPPRSHSPE